VRPRDGSASPPPQESQSPPEVPAAGRDDSGDDGPAAAASRGHVLAPGIVVDDPGGFDAGLPAGVAPEGDPAFNALLETNRETFIPTAAETRAGIDPNDAGTWPEGYRGPAIERMIQKQREAGGGPEPDVSTGFLPANR